MKVLGIDLGTNSLGWAILDSEKKKKAIVDAGVVIFEEGIKREKGRDSLTTPAAERRTYRSARRQKFRRRMRKIKTLEILIAHGMCPLKPEELDAWRKDNQYPLNNRAFLNWLKSTHTDNPYGDRAAAATQKVAPDVLGRAIYHLAQRRGFLSNRKNIVEANAPGEEGKKSKKKVDERSKVKNSIAQLTAILEEKNWTLGQHFHDLYQRGEKVRGCYTGRVEHYQKEFDQIASVQKMDAALAKKIRDVLFFQRRLRSQSHLVGKCPLEKSHSRCLVAHPVFEMYRMWTFINTIRTIDENGDKIPLSDEERQRASRAFFKTARYISFADIAKALKKPEGTRYNYPDKKTVPTCSVTHQLNKLLGGDCFAWKRTVKTADGRDVTYTYQTAFDALMFFEDADRLQVFAREKLGLAEAEAEAFSKIVCRDGYAQYSLCALRKITPFVERGIELSQAIFLANMPAVLGADAFEANQEQIIADVAERAADYLENREVPLQKRLRDYMQAVWKVSPEDFERLYFRVPGQDNSYASAETGGDMLPPVNMGMLRNPLVQRALTILRKQVNFLRRTGRIDANTRIHVELARSVNDRNTRMAYATWQQSRQAARDEARQRLITDLKHANPSDTDILRYILWKEQDMKCLYTGQTIGQHELLTPAFDIEHTIPRSRSGNNSRANLTLCDHVYNRQRKRGRLPTECDNYDEIHVRLTPWREKVEQLENTYLQQMRTARNTPADNPELKSKNRQKALVTQMEWRYWREKLKAFTLEADHLDDKFMNRQLVDTGIITRHAVALLRSVYPQTYPVNGTAVAWARQGWGIQEITEQKERTTHLHHAVDAMVIAGLDRKRFNDICAYCKDDGEKDYDLTLPESLHPFPGFAQAVFDKADDILVKHIPRRVAMKQTHRKAVHLARPMRTLTGQVRRKVPARGDTVRGQLHKESFYGCIQSPETGKKQFVIRKPLNSESFATRNSLDKIVDPIVRQTVQDQLQTALDQGVPLKKALDETTFHMPSGVPIKNVRIYADNITDPKEVRTQAFPSKHDYKNLYYAESGTDSNFRMALYRQEKNGKIKWNYIADNLFDWTQRNSEEGELHDKKDLGQFVGYIIPGAMALTYEQTPSELHTFGPRQLKKRLYKVVRFESRYGRITMRLHSEARASTDLGKYLLSIHGKFKTGLSTIDYVNPHLLLYLSPSTYSDHVLFEGIHFDMDLAGKITFRDYEC